MPWLQAPAKGKKQPTCRKAAWRKKQTVTGSHAFFPTPPPIPPSPHFTSKSSTTGSTGVSYRRRAVSARHWLGEDDEGGREGTCVRVRVRVREAALLTGKGKGDTTKPYGGGIRRGRPQSPWRRSGMGCVAPPPSWASWRGEESKTATLGDNGSKRALCRYRPSHGTTGPKEMTRFCRLFFVVLREPR